MTAKAAGFVSRAAAGLVPPRAVSHDISPEKGGLAVHYGGAVFPISSHAKCLEVWRGYQKWHMRPNGLGVPAGGNDIAYNFGICPHGYVMAGRGLGVRSGANGAYQANTDYYAVCWMNSETSPNRLVLDALEWVIQQVRDQGAALRVRPHRAFYQTECPGSSMADAIKKYDGRVLPKVDVPNPPDKPVKAPKFPLKPGQFFGFGGIVSRSGLSIWQGKMHSRGWTIAVDGKWNVQDDKVCRQFQREKRLDVDGKVGPKTWAATWTAKIT